MTTRLTAKSDFAINICNALGLNSSEVRRIVMDIKADSAVVFYVEMYGTDRLINVSIPSDIKETAEITILEKVNA